MTRQKTYPELNYFNAVSCLLVILIHVLSVGITSLEKNSLQMAIVFLPWRLSTYVVPGFLFIGAVKMALGFSADGSADGRSLTLSEYGRYILSRILKIYLPYVAWVAVYYIYFLRIGWVEPGIGVFLRYVLVGDLSAQLYYIVVVMQFYLLMPLWRWAVKKIPFYTAILTAAMITFGMLYAEDILLYIGISFPWCNRIFLSYLLYWVLGLYIGRHYDTVREVLKKHIRSVMAMCIPVLLYGVGMLIQYTRDIVLFDGDVIKVFSYCMMICIVFTLCILFSDHASNVSALRIWIKPLSFVYAASYTVYLSHCLFLQMIAAEMNKCGITDIGVQLILRAAVCYTAPFLLWYGWHWIKKGISRLKIAAAGK